ncbi:DEAD/DEAH box helicase family protein [Pedobacter punctiformis]|uniref:DEAD/DEAH box helicase family protein n=1 Tax=Pedobacter punctiformis TaxID=3004097 RepID=A0ABT4LC21_9SPHI|nr:DEAD/DEAH box helicase family protein [Pedobacter sp. HCMS5-2]MCZ4245465.1 DEAD/DEAH box helicase family protein [Pedobacter sp. HCMS5-2]
MLKDVDFKPFYTSGEDAEPSEFLFDGLINSQRFDLGLGFFRSTGFSTLAIGFASFLSSGGTMRFIINDSLAEKDKAALLKGAEEKSDEEYEQELIKDIENLTKTLTKRNQHFFDCLSWLVSSGRLELIAVVPRKNKVGIVHHKFGIFTDEQGNQAAFNGSLNFSQYALNYNVESIWCEYSWDAQGIAEKRIAEMIRLFENTWHGTSPAVRVIPLENVKVALQKKYPKKTLKELVETECVLATEVIKHPGTSPLAREKLRQMVAKMSKIGERLTSDTKAIEPEQQTPNKWVHQDNAISKFLEQERGVLNMATGTGKTRTSLRICKELIQRKQIDCIIISCDGTDLLNQWKVELLKLLRNENIPWIVLKNYSDFHDSETFRLNPVNRILLTSRLQLHKSLKSLPEKIAGRTLMIHDEVHKLGSAGNRTKLQGLSEGIRFRLGLSATPERDYDEEGTQFILDHIGPIIFEFPLEKAIAGGILAPFNYYPIPYELSADDKIRLKNVYSKKAARLKEGNPLSDEEFYNEIARVYKTAEGKVPAFKDFISRHSEMLDRTIVFVETKEYGEGILDIIHQYHADFHTYFGEDDPSVLNRFSNNEIDCLLTCHRISEGIDIKSLLNVILFSSSKAMLETIQRIGRCLRTDPNNPSKVANVIDFIRHSDNDEYLNSDAQREQFLESLSKIRP